MLQSGRRKCKNQPNDQNRFYEIAYSSAMEALNLLILCNELAYINENDLAELRSKMESTTIQINRLSNKKTLSPKNI